MSSNLQQKIETKLVHAGRDPEKSFGFINIPPVRGSTVLHASVADMRERERCRNAGIKTKPTYGIWGGPTHEGFYEALNALEGGAGSWAFSSGLAGCTVPFLAFVKAGDHILVSDSVYGPTREFCEEVLSGLGVETTFYDPLIGPEIEALFQSNTRLLFMETPGTHTFEMQDVPLLSSIAAKKSVWTMIDNTWATPLYFNPLKVGVDVVIHAATKYICGHADVLMSTVTANEKAWPYIHRICGLMGQAANADDVYLAHRGLHTLQARVEKAVEGTRAIIAWLENRSEVDRIVWPAYEKDPGYAIWKRDYSGATSLFGFTFAKEYADSQIDTFLDALKIFGRGYSWGSYESLLIRSYGRRTVRSPEDLCRMVRVSVGLENPLDLIEDIEQAFAAMK